MLLVVSTITRRSEIAIVVDILKAAEECGTNKTGIVYAANLNFNRAGRYPDSWLGSLVLTTGSDVGQGCNGKGCPRGSCRGRIYMIRIIVGRW